MSAGGRPVLDGTADTGPLANGSESAGEHLRNAMHLLVNLEVTEHNRAVERRILAALAIIDDLKRRARAMGGDALIREVRSRL